MDETISGRVILKKGREKPILNKHPWVFSGAISRIEGDPSPGALVTVNNHNGIYLATGYFNPVSQIQVRLLTWDSNQLIDKSFWWERLQAAIQARTILGLEPRTDAYRLVNAEADRIPGFIVDRYKDHLVIQCLTLGIERQKDTLVECLVDLVNPIGILERSDASVRKIEGLEIIKNNVWGQDPPTDMIIQENGYRFLVDLWEGHKTGFYLDQRDNRMLLRRSSFLSGKTVLNVFAYTGAFSVYAAGAGVESITNIDTSIPALETAERNIALNEFDRPQDNYIAGDAFEVLRYLRDEGQSFDFIILDPPKFAQRRGDIERATRGYKDLNLLAFQLLAPGGILASFSCSGQVSAELFQKILFSAAVDAGREVQILRTLTQSADHPILLTFPESAYLKGFLCRAF